MTEQVQALSVFDALKLLDKDLIEKVLAIAKTVNVEHLENGLIRISIDVATK